MLSVKTENGKNMKIYLLFGVCKSCNDQKWKKLNITKLEKLRTQIHENLLSLCKSCNGQSIKN